MKYEDLLTVPYKAHGRGDGGYDCYGLVAECCRRAGTPLADPFKSYIHMKAGAELALLGDLNIKEIPGPREGAIVEMAAGENLHAGYMVSRDRVLHITERGARVTHIKAVHAVKFYEVINENQSD